jgi:hypothetical protein
MLTRPHCRVRSQRSNPGSGSTRTAQDSSPPWHESWLARPLLACRSADVLQGGQVDARSADSQGSGSANSRQQQAAGGWPGSATPRHGGVEYSCWTLGGWPHSAHLSSGFFAWLMPPAARTRTLGSQTLAGAAEVERSNSSPVGCCWSDRLSRSANGALHSPGLVVHFARLGTGDPLPATGEPGMARKLSADLRVRSRRHVHHRRPAVNALPSTLITKSPTQAEAVVALAAVHRVVPGVPIRRKLHGRRWWQVWRRATAWLVCSL